MLVRFMLCFALLMTLIEEYFSEHFWVLKIDVCWFGNSETLVNHGFSYSGKDFIYSGLFYLKL
jgi:hypothetical protein